MRYRLNWYFLSHVRAKLYTSQGERVQSILLEKQGIQIRYKNQTETILQA